MFVDQILPRNKSMNSMYVSIFFLLLILLGPILTMRLKPRYLEPECSEAEALVAYQMLQQRVFHLDNVNWKLLTAHAAFISFVVGVISLTAEWPQSLAQDFIPFWVRLQQIIKPWYAGVQFIFLLPLAISIFKLASLLSRLWAVEFHTSLGFSKPWKAPLGQQLPHLNVPQWIHLWLAWGAWAFCWIPIR